MSEELNDIAVRCRDCVTFLARVPLKDEYGAGVNEVTVSQKTLNEAADEIVRLRISSGIAENMEYLAANAFEFHLTVNPHAGVFDTVEEHTSARASDEPLGDWISEEQHEEALNTGRFIEGHLYPNGSVSFYVVWGTRLADVVAECAKLCREDRESWIARNGETQSKPIGRDSDRTPA